MAEQKQPCRRRPDPARAAETSPLGDAGLSCCTPPSRRTRPSSPHDGGAAGLSRARSATARAGAFGGAGRAVRVRTASPSAGLLLQLGPERRGFLAEPPAAE
jgi:hypothetical protein